MNRSDSVKELASALAKAQGEMTNPKFDTQNPFFKSMYASLASVRDSVIPVFSKNGLSIIQSLRSTEKGVECETMLMHNSGEWVSDTLSLPISKHDAQGYGSAATYARRYSLMSFSGVVGDKDDDGNAAVETKGKKAASIPAAPTPPVYPVDRTAVLTDLCEKAEMALVQVLVKAEVDSADAMSEEDFESACAMLKRIAIKNAKAAKETK